MASPTYGVTSLALSLLPPRDRKRAKGFAGFLLDWTEDGAIAAGASKFVRFTVPTDVAGFVACFATGSGLTTGMFVNFQLRDKWLFDRDVHYYSFGRSTPDSPFVLPFPLIIPSGATLTAKASNTHTAANAFFRILLLGFVLHNYEAVNAYA